MRFLVISTPKYQVPLEQLPGLLAAEREWYDRNREYLETYGWFPEGGGFGVADVPDVETLSRINNEHPFAYVATAFRNAGLLAAEVNRLAPVALIRKGRRFALVPFDATFERRQELLTALEK